MTSSRVIRGTKVKIFFYVCAVLVITGLIACYNNTLSQLDDIKKSNEICHQHQENLSTQLQVISDYKQKLEKSLKHEKAEHLQSKNNFEIKINEEKSKSEKLTNDALLKYNSLQQHYRLLQTQYDDFKEDCSIIQKKHLDDNNSLQSKLKEVEEELKKLKASKEGIKTQYTELELEMQKLKQALTQKDNDESQKTINFFSNKYHDLEEKYKVLQQKCGSEGGLPDPNTNLVTKPSEKGVFNMRPFNGSDKFSSSTKSNQQISPSQGSLNGARPLLLPSVTPETVKKKLNLKPPQGVPAVPENRENQNEQPELQFQKKNGKDDLEKDNGAHEVFDLPVQNNAVDGLAFGDSLNKQDGHLEKKHVDTFGKSANKKDEQDYKDLQHEEEGDDDIDGYVDNQARQQYPAVRN